MSLPSSLMRVVMTLALGMFLGLAWHAPSAFAQEDCPPLVSPGIGLQMGKGCAQILDEKFDSVASCQGVTNEMLSRILCIVESRLSVAASLMYCGIAKAIEKPLALAILLYITLMGFTLALGLTKLTFGEIFVRGLKIVLVWLCATKAEYGINVIYYFFMTIMRQGIHIVTRLNVWGTEGGTTGISGSGCASQGMGLFVHLQEMVSNLLGVDPNNSVGSLIGVMFSFVMTDATLGLIGVVLFLVAAIVLAAAFLRAIMAYLLALMVIAFLVALSPIFLTLALFNQYPTFKEYFDNWLNTLGSHTLQPIFLFAVLYFVMAMMVTNMQFLTNMARPCATLDRNTGVITRTPGLDLARLTKADGSTVDQPSSCIMYFDRIKVRSIGVEALEFRPIFFHGYILYYGEFDPAWVQTYHENGQYHTSIDVTPEGNQASARNPGFIVHYENPHRGQISFCSNAEPVPSGAGVISAVAANFAGPGSCSADFSNAFILNMLLLILKCGLILAYLDSAADHIAALATRFAEKLGGMTPFVQGPEGSDAHKMLGGKYGGTLDTMLKGRPGGAIQLSARGRHETRGAAQRRRAEMIVQAVADRAGVGGAIDKANWGRRRARGAIQRIAGLFRRP